MRNVNGLLRVRGQHPASRYLKRIDELPHEKNEKHCEKHFLGGTVYSIYQQTNGKQSRCNNINVLLVKMNI